MTLDSSILRKEIPMPISAETLSAQAMQLSPNERLALVDQLLDTPDEPDVRD